MKAGVSNYDPHAEKKNARGVQGSGGKSRNMEKRHQHGKQLAGESTRDRVRL